MIRKADMVKNLVDKFGFTKVYALEIFDSIVSQMKAELMKGSDVIIAEFVTMSVKDTMGRTVVVPSTEAVYEARVYKRVKASFSKKFRDEVKHS